MEVETVGVWHAGTESEAPSANIALIAAREAERARLARELHDELGAHLTALRFALARIESCAAPRMSPACIEALASANSALDDACSAGCRIIADLAPLPPGTSLLGALSDWADDFAARTGLRALIRCAPDTRLESLTREGALAVFRIVQEALNNAAKHAQANTVEIAIEAQYAHLSLTIKDDGRGLPRHADIEPTAVGGTKGFGLAAMRARTEAFGGSLRIASPIGAGLTLHARLSWQALLFPHTVPA